MYSSIQGAIAMLNPTFVVIECGGIGYELNISLNTYSAIKAEKQCKLYTHLIVREDAMLLYGFSDINERKLFKQLITVPGCGAATSMLILSSLTYQETNETIANGRSEVLLKIKGIGSKTAQRIIIDLKDKIIKENAIVVDENFSSEYNTNREEALSALLMLGFNKISADKAVSKILKNNNSQLTVEQLIKESLKIL